ncbi:PREDICTED: cell differentiation protein RCD1 homolog isoform X2 [Populus euphratica]|nr:PREDICTED: cell differentiation protein RCD1 homolog isoform X2 [Populus euphratica]
MAPLLWHSVGTISILLQEIISVYHSLHSPIPTLTDRVSNRVSDALVLFQCVAANPSTKMPFIEAKLPLYLYPLLNNTKKERPHQFIRLASLSVIGALAKVDDPNVINFLLESEVFPCCIRSMEVGDVLSKTVATYIVYKILINEEGLRYCCTVAERFFALVRVLGSMVLKLAEEGQLAKIPFIRLLKHIILCYHRLSESPRSCDGLRCCLPVILSDAAFIDIIRLGDPSAVHTCNSYFTMSATEPLEYKR